MKRISNVDEACDLIGRWFEWSEDLGGPELTLPFPVPPAIRTVHRRLGRLWLDPAGPAIFSAQDHLIPPWEYRPDESGVVTVLSENQGVWQCGFTPETGSRLWVSDDWPDDHQGSPEWRATSDVIDTPIIFALLANTVFASQDCRWDEDERPEGARWLLWSFAPFGEFSGFWTDDGLMLIRMQGTDWAATAYR